jgi:hypothetical protein
VAVVDPFDVLEEIDALDIVAGRRQVLDAPLEGRQSRLAGLRQVRPLGDAECGLFARFGERPPAARPPRPA